VTVSTKTADKAQQPEEDAADWYWTDPKTLKVNPAFQSLIPLQAKGELLAPEQSIGREGCRDPLLVWQGHNVVLDGHTGRELCLKHKRRVKVREVELPDEKAAAEYVLQVQRQRRNLMREAMSYFRGVEYNAVKQQHGGSRRGRKPSGQNDHLSKTGAHLAEKYGVSDKTIRRDAAFAKVIDKIVEGYGDPEVKRKLLGADVRLTYGTARVLLRMPAKERKAAVNELVEKGELPRAKKGAATGRRPKEVAHSLVSRLQKKGDGHAKSVLQRMARLPGMEVVEK
jgi:hypothetical protein